MDGLHPDLNVGQVLLKLFNFTQPRNNSSSRPAQIYGGDLIIAMNILSQTAEYNARFGNVSSKEDFQNYVQVASNLMEPVNRGTWVDLDRVSSLNLYKQSGNIANFLLTLGRLARSPLISNISLQHKCQWNVKTSDIFLKVTSILFCQPRLNDLEHYLGFRFHRTNLSLLPTNPPLPYASWSLGHGLLPLLIATALKVKSVPAVI